MAAQHVRRLVPRTALAAFALAALCLLATPAAGGVWFEDVSLERGLRFARAGDRDNPDPLFIEIMGGGACWLDVDNDGWLDAFLVNGWLDNTTQAAQQQPRSRLFQSLGPGPDGVRFEDATDRAQLQVQGWTQGCAAADYDGDGFDDLFVTGRGIHALFRNQGDGTFRNVSAEANVSAEGKCPDEPCWGTSAAWADYDRDGDLDLYTISFVAFDINAHGQHTRGPHAWPGQPNQLYRNDGDGTFTDVTAASGANGQPSQVHSKNWGVVWLDYNNDGWLDLYIASDGVPNILYENHGDGTFTDEAVPAGVADARNGMGVASNDCDEDGDEDLYFTHYFAVKSDLWWGWDGFFVNNGNETFTDKSGTSELWAAEPYVKWGVGWEDFDNDADLDLHVTSGHTENSDLPQAPPNREQPPLLWMGDRTCAYDDVRAVSGPGIQVERMGRGSHYADFDLDGDLDILVVSLMNQTSLLLEASGAGPNWLSLELRDAGAANHKGIGAKVEVQLPDGHVLHRRVMPYQSIHGSNQHRLHVGLGDFTTANVTVKWPDTWQPQRFEGLQGGQLLRLHRDGTVQDDTLPPRSALVVQGTPGEGPWYRSPVLVDVEADDLGVSRVAGVARTFLRLGQGAETADPAPLALGEGLHTLRHRSLDHAGNAEPVRTRVLGVDATAPASAAQLEGALVDGWYQGPVRVALSCADALSGVDRVEWRLDGGAWVRYDGPFDLTRPGSHALAWRCVDQAGNVEAAHTLSVAVDLGRPETLARLDGPAGEHGWFRGPVTVTLDAAGGPRAVATTLLGVDGGDLAPYGGPVVLAADGVHTLRFRSTDAEGREEPLQTLEVRVDGSPPVLGLVDRGGPSLDGVVLRVGPWHGLVPLAWDNVSGLADLQLRGDYESGFHPFGRPLRVYSEGLHPVQLQARDQAGNEAFLERAVFLDLTPPALTVTSPLPQTVLVGPYATFPLALNPLAVDAVLLGPAPVEVDPEDPAGIRRVHYYVDSFMAANLTQEPYRWSWSMPPGNQFRILDVQAIDGVNNSAWQRLEVWATGWVGPEPPPVPVLPEPPAAPARAPFLPERDAFVEALLAQAPAWALPQQAPPTVAIAPRATLSLG